MDCEKFDNVMLDELYGELDELTSAAAKRHLSGCARCTAQYAGMKATRRVAILPLVDPPADLEDKIFARVKEAQKVVPFRARAIKFLSIAGSWAMRPQTAMAAVFLLMIGSSVLFMKVNSKNASSVRVSSDFGAPESTATSAADGRERMDYAAAASAHGKEVPATKGALPAPTTIVADNLDPNDLAKNKDEEEKSRDGFESQARTTTQNAPGAGGGAWGQGLTNAGPIGGTPPMATATSSPYQQGQQVQTEAKKDSQNEFDRGLGQYRDKKYDDAVRTLDGVSGSPDAALWAARAVRDSKGCGEAVKRYEDLMARMWGTNASYEAAMDAAKCYESMGNMNMARAKYSKLLDVPQYAARAQNELDRLRPVSAKPAAPMRSQDDKLNNSL